MLNKQFPHNAQRIAKNAIAKLNDVWRMHQIVSNGIEEIKSSKKDETINLIHYIDGQPLRCSVNNYYQQLGIFMHDDLPRTTFIKMMMYTKKALLDILTKYHANCGFYDDFLKTDVFSFNFSKLCQDIRCNHYGINLQQSFESENNKQILEDFNAYIKLYDEIINQNKLIKINMNAKYISTLRNFILVFTYYIITKNYSDFKSWDKKFSHKTLKLIEKS